MRFIEREIRRERGFAGTLRVTERGGRPAPSLPVFLEQQGVDLAVGVRWAGEELGLVRLFARAGTHLFAAQTEPAWLHACREAGLQPGLVVPAPGPDADPDSWARRSFPGDLRARLGDPSAVVAVEAPAGPFDSDALARALDAAASAVGRSPWLFGLPLPLPPQLPPAAGYGVRLDRAAKPAGSAGAPRQAAVRRLLLQAGERTGSLWIDGFFFTSGPGEAPDSVLRLGGEERARAERLAQWLTLFYSVGAVRGVSLPRLADPPAGSSGDGLFDARGRPTRAFRVLRSLLQHAWPVRLSGATDPAGEFRWQGTFGRWRLVVQPDRGPARVFEREFAAGDRAPLWTVQL